jgi:hypothetical protein
LSGLKEISAKIGGASANEPVRRIVESALSDAVRMHPGRPTVNIQCVDQMFGDKDDLEPREEAASRYVFALLSVPAIFVVRQLTLLWQPNCGGRVGGPCHTSWPTAHEDTTTLVQGTRCG